MQPETHENDSELVARAAAGDQLAFADIYNQNHAQVFGYLRARVLDSSTAEDLAQEVFMRSYRILNRFNEDGRIRPWLLGIARNVLREHIRRVTRRKEVGWAELCFELEDVFDEHEMYEDILPMLPDCMSKLGQSATEAIRSHYISGKKVKEIAAELDRSVGAVKVLMVRARQALKKCIQSQMKSAPVHE